MMIDDRLTRFVEQAMIAIAIAMFAVVGGCLLCGCYKPTFYTTLYETHTHYAAPASNPGALGATERRPGAATELKGELDGLAEGIQNDARRSRGHADRPGPGG